MGLAPLPEGDSHSEVRPRPRSRRGVKVLAAAGAFAAALAAFGAGAVLATHHDGGTPHHGMAAAISLPPSARLVHGSDLDGRSITPSQFAGKPLVVAFFGSWCGPCHQDAPVFPSVAREFAGRVSFLGIAVSDTAASDRAFVARYRWTWPVVEDGGYRWSVAFDVPGVPSTYVLDAHGRVADRIVGSVSLDRLSRDLRRLLVAG
jgi:cytochrome c biogenesis protein CcmG/thiol:disulfide interchange protein DsbE